MYIKRIKLTNFMQFEHFEASFEDINLLLGKIGSGKTTIGYFSLLFALWGYIPKKTMSDIVTKGNANKCAVELEIKHNNKIYTITREYPLKITIKINGVIEKLSTADANKYIVDTFGTRENFQRFRVLSSAVDNDINFLEAGSSTLKKIIFNQSDILFNNVKENLLKIKGERERYQKNKVITKPCYPSIKRFKYLENIIKILESKKNSTALNEVQNSILSCERDIATLKQKEKQLAFESNSLNKEKRCFTCKQLIANDTHKTLIEDRKIALSDISNKLTELNEKVERLNDIKILEEERLNEKQEKINKISKLKERLYYRLQQVDYKYSEKDLIISKEALTELDKLSSYYLKETIKTLEPIINSILDRIDYTLEFDVDDKGKFNILLHKKGETYSYQDLSQGQKFILQVAIKIAIILEKNIDGIIICDEGMSNLDSESLDYVLDFIRGFKQLQLIFVIHRYESSNPNINIITLGEEDENVFYRSS